MGSTRAVLTSVSGRAGGAGAARPARRAGALAGARLARGRQRARAARARHAPVRRRPSLRLVARPGPEAFLQLTVS